MEEVTKMEGGEQTGSMRKEEAIAPLFIACFLSAPYQ